MDTKGHSDKRISDASILTLAILVGGVGLFALLGWFLKIPKWASFGTDLIPMAPSTAALFVISGAAIVMRARTPLNSCFYWAGAVVGCGITIVALLLFGLAYMDIHCDIEHLGFDITGTLRGSNLGHMSAVTALGFVVAGLSFLASLSPRNTSAQHRVMALGFAGLLLGMSLVFLLAYFFGTPLLYGGRFIPPAVNTLLAFVMLSFALLIPAWNSSDNQNRLTARGLETFHLLLLVFILLAGGISTFGSMMGFLLIGAGVSVGLVWWRQHVRLSRERAGAMEAVHQSEERYHSLIFNMTEGVALHQMVYAEDGKPVNYRIVDVNPAFERHTGIAAANARGRLATEAYQAAAPPYFDIFEKVARTGEPYSFEKEFPDLNRIFSISVYSPKKGWFATVFTDITHRVKTDESHARLATAVEQAAEIIVITDAEALILYANPAFEKITGYTRQEAIGKNPRILKSGKHDSEFYHRMWEVLYSGKVWTGRITNKRKDGTLYEEDASISPVVDSAGRIVNYVGVKRDITREVQLEQQFLQAQKMEAIGRLAGGVAHDFNNILAVIMMNGSELMEDKAITTAQSDGINEIIQAAERGANLTRQMLAFSRRQIMQLRALDLNDVVVGVIKMLQRLIGVDVVLQTRLSDDDVLVWGDVGMLEQVLMNLAVNARDAMPEGGQLSIELGVITVDETRAAGHSVKAGEFVRMTVRDTGSGILPENLPHIFEPFYTTKAAGKGTGLGLATLHGIVEQHQGWVEVDSSLGQGTAFHIFLPRLSASHRVRPEQQEAVVVEGGLETVLLVEDEPSLRALAFRILRHYGYRVLEARNGVEALEVWRQHSSEVDLLLTDIIMPEGISGGKLSQLLLAEKPGLKVIYMSGYPGEVAGSGLNLTEGRKFLQKPFAPSKLVQMVRESLNAV